ncbi:hypothetical protein BKA82DRAFT_4018535 [Pisolithus tinctorius]|nr:hypothetical protein BKA82DRAFT_4018535 [Pisolithus tinctorius]
MGMLLMLPQKLVFTFSQAAVALLILLPVAILELLMEADTRFKESQSAGVSWACLWDDFEDSFKLLSSESAVVVGGEDKGEKWSFKNMLEDVMLESEESSIFGRGADRTAGDPGMMEDSDDASDKHLGTTGEGVIVGALRKKWGGWGG